MAKSWQTLSSEQVYTTPWMTVRRDEVLNHAGTPLTYSVIEMRKMATFIVAVNSAGQICQIHNYRYALDMMMWEVPAGFGETGETPLAAAKRELQEETGLTSDDWTELGTLYQANGIGKIPLTVFLARDVHGQLHTNDKDEEITTRRFVDLADIEQMIAKGEIIESAHIAAIYLAKLHGLTK